MHDDSIQELCPGPRLSYRESVRRALTTTQARRVTTSWSGAATESAAGALPTDPDWAGGAVLRDTRRRTVEASPEVVHRTVCGIGGQRGWHHGERLWEVRGLLDSLVGGPGMRRGRRDPDELRVGDALDFWRVERVEFPELLPAPSRDAPPGRGLAGVADHAVAGRQRPPPARASSRWPPSCPVVSGAAPTGTAWLPSTAPWFPGLLDGIAREAEHAVVDHAAVSR